MPSAAAASVRRGEAGRAGKDVRSDLRVIFEERNAGGIEVELQSRVDLYYGEAIRIQATSVLHALGVSHAYVQIVDEGALPFVIDARVEAAVLRAGITPTMAALPDTAALPPASPRDRLRRSRLYLPGNEPKYFINAGLHAPDGVILDLEDSVHHAEKDAARLLVRNALRAVDFGHCERMVRINPFPIGRSDLEAIIPQHPNLILIPKVEHAEQVREVDALITAMQGHAGTDRPLWLMPIVETALGVENMYAIAHASARNAAITIGLEDYTADLGVVKTATGAESLYARMRLVNAAKAAGLQAIDSVYGDVADAEGLLRWGEASRAMGFEGMGCVHPQQIRIIHAAFAPSAAEIEKALKIANAFEEAQARGLGVVSVGSKMIDPPVVHRAVKLVERARQMGLVPAEIGTKTGAKQ
jgi:citrate lyase subunit beta / citryl-CoA lyase